jgi:phage terminase large subunit-like protein
MDHGERNHSIPCALPLECVEARLPIEPYLLGYWLGNGSSSGAEITGMDLEPVRAFEAAGFHLREYGRSGLATTYGITYAEEAEERRDGTTGRYITAGRSFKADLRALDLLGNKHIPPAYLRASIPQRRALLQGLMDSDGYCDTRGKKLAGAAEYTSTNDRLAADVRELCLSLGYKATLNVGHATIDGRYISDKYRITFTVNSDEPLFRVARKLARQGKPGAQRERARRRYIVDCDPVPSVPVRCITVDSPSHLYLAGREMIPTHNTRTIMEFVREEVQAGRAARVAFVAATTADSRDVLVTGHSGILAISPPWFKPTYEPTKRRLTRPNGAIATTYSADEPDRLRGPQFDLAVCDELAAWRYPEALDMLLLGLRIGKNPRLAIATTPRPTKLIRGLLAREGKDVAVTRGSTLENKDHLAPAYIEQIIARYAGTRLERQEVFGEVLEDAPGALWSREAIERTRVSEAPPLQRIVVAIDPAGSAEEGADETGIVVAGLGQDGHGYVLDDLSGRFDPVTWARQAIGAYHVWKADKVVVERNYGGDMASATITSVDPNIPVKEVSSSRGKVLRAEPVAAFFEQGRAHFVGQHPNLEDQACRFTPDWSRDRDGSPDRIDSMVFALTEVLLSEARPEGFIKTASLLAATTARPQTREPVPMPRRCLSLYASCAASLTDPDALAVVFFGVPPTTGQEDSAYGPLTVIDWGLARAEADTLPQWPRQIAERLLALRTETGGQLLGVCIEAAGIGTTVVALAEQSHLDVFECVTDQYGPGTERVLRAAGHVAAGRVQLAAPAHEKTATFKGVTRNHLLAQVGAFGLSQESQGLTELLVAFANGVCVKYEEPRARSRMATG